MHPRFSFSLIGGLFLAIIGLVLTKNVYAAQFPLPTGFVNDFAGVLTAEQKSSLEQNLQDFEKKTTNEISVVTIKNLQGETIENYAVKLFEQWKIGKKGKDNGILLLIALEDRKLRIEVGYGLEPRLTDGQAGEIIRNIITPEFKKNNYYQGILKGVQAIEDKVTGETSSNVTKQKDDIVSAVMFLIFLLLIAFFILRILLRLGYTLGKTKGIIAGPIGGLSIGGVIGIFFGSLKVALILAIILGIVGLILDIIFSLIYHFLPKTEKRTAAHKFFHWWGTLDTGKGSGFGGGGFGGGFGGGGSGGGGASGSW